MQNFGPVIPRTPSPSYQTACYVDAPGSEKRQRSSSEENQSDFTSPSKRINSSPSKRGSGKDGAEVWPEDVEEAFMEGGLYLNPFEAENI